MGNANPRRYSGNSKTGRQIMSANSLHNNAETKLTQEQKDWNAQVEAKRQLKLKRKEQSK